MFRSLKYVLMIHQEGVREEMKGAGSLVDVSALTPT